MNVKCRDNSNCRGLISSTAAAFTALALLRVLSIASNTSLATSISYPYLKTQKSYVLHSVHC